MQDILQQERRAFSADLHDSIAQILGYLRLTSAQLYQQCKQPAYQELIEQVEDISNYTHYAYQQVRELITASRLAQELDFIKALKKVIQEFEQQSSIVFELDHRAHHINIQPRHSVQVLYIIRESLSNIVRHSHASYARIYLHVEEQKLQVRISDNGQGIDLHRKRKDSFGLDIMQERAERIGAILKIYPEQPQGTCVELTLNLKGGE
ncbi:sensor histidine kinase [Acinetobacter indicus]|jgi:nitrate/nitrite-specific signal transduction histidine kinase|nr:ATP-binding protein [Acinetobacter indicus]